MARRILMVAFHYPPIQGSSGVHRTLSFSRHLAAHGWSPTVLTVTRGALPSYRDSNESMIPAGVTVLRAMALDASRHLTIRGKYLGLTALPDRWVSWVLPAVVRGLVHIWQQRPDVIHSTYPIASAHIIGYLLHRLSGVPWIADLRDPMAQDDYPRDPRTRRAFFAIEKRIVKHAAKIVFAAPSARDYYAQRYPAEIAGRGVVIENGYDEELFTSAETALNRVPQGPLRLVHSGVLYPEERDPTSFFAALRALRDEQRIDASRLTVCLRASGHDDLYRPRIAALGIEDLVHLAPPVDYAQALAEMLEADGLLVFQSAGCNFQIPAKLYEYVRARRPIIGLTDPQGDSAAVLRAAGVPWVARLDSEEEIKETLAAALTEIAAHRGERFGDDAFVAACSREARAGEYLALVEDVARGR